MSKILKIISNGKNKANLIFGIIRRGVSYKSVEVRSYVRPYLDYCIQFWSPGNEKDAAMLEGVQRRATKMIPCLRNLSYKERLKRLGMLSLRHRMRMKEQENIDCLKIRRHVNSNIE